MKIKNSISLILIFLSFSTIGQVVDFDSEAIEKDFTYNLNLYGDAFISPIMESYSASQIASNQISAKVLKPFAFGVGFTGSLTFVDEDKMNFNFNTIGFSDNLTLSNPADSILPTSLGGFTTKSMFYKVEGTTLGGTGTFDFEQNISALDGIKTPMNSIPSGAIAVQVGLPLNTEIYVRFLPKLDFEDITNYSVGGGIKHMISQYFIDEEKDFHLALSGYYGSTNFTFLPSNYLEGSNQKISFINKVYSAEIVASIDKDFFSFFGLIGYFSGDSEFNIAGTYKYNVERQDAPAPAPPTVQEAFVVTDPVSINRSTSGIQSTVGASFKIKELMSLALAYHIANENSLSVNLRFFINNGEK